MRCHQVIQLNFDQQTLLSQTSTNTLNQIQNFNAKINRVEKNVQQIKFWFFFGLVRKKLN